MVETAFYVIGGALVIAALLLTAIGLRWERFPGSRGSVAVLAVVFAGMVGATGTLAWINAEDEQREHADELAEERAAAAEERAAEQREAVAGVEGEAPPAGGGGGEDAGLQVFNDAGCGGCHTLAAAGSTAQVGPDLDEVLPGQDQSEVEGSIVDPSAELTPGFPDQMPGDFEERLSGEELDALVEFLIQSTS